jgi:histidyl-tRNA synthetase
MIIRGLDYYTGTVFETFLKDYREIGSISSGGRYENLANNFTEQKFPGVGGSIGLTRLFFVLNDQKLINIEADKPVDYVVIPFSKNEYSYAMQIAAKLRNTNKSVDIDFDDRKLGNKFNRAAKIAKYAVVIGEDEVKSGNIQAKNLETGETAPLDI